IATESGVYHVSLGETLADENDDIWTDFSEAPGLSGQTVSDLEWDAGAANVWFTTPSGIVRLNYGADPLNEATNTWTSWAPEVEGASLDIGPVMTVAPDGAVWLRSPQGAAVRVAGVDQGNDSLTYYHPSSRPDYASIPSDERVYSLVVDDRGDKWLSWRGSLLHFDDGGTVTDTTDHRWTLI